jgi:hypothetical protein
MFLDCCYEGIHDKGTKRIYPDPETKDFYAYNLKKMIEPTDTTNAQKAVRRNAVLASSEATAVSRERNNCIHSDDDKPHSHGIFTYHLIEGLDGKAADPDRGVITIEGLRRHIENQMIAEGGQIPIYYVENASSIETIKIATSQQLFNAKITEIIKEVDDLCEIKYPNSDLIDLQVLALAAKKVGELIRLDPSNREISRLQKVIDEATKAYIEPTLNWIGKNNRFAILSINQIEPGLYAKLADLVLNLSFRELQKMDQTKLAILMTLFDEVARNTDFTSADDRRLKMFQVKLRSLLNV